MKNNIPSDGNYILPELLPLVTERRLFNRHNKAMLSVNKNGRPFNSIMDGIGKFNFDIGILSANADTKERHMYNIEFSCQFQINSAYYYGHYKGILTVVQGFLGGLLTKYVMKYF